MQEGFCPNCSAKIEINETEKAFVCPKCGRPFVVADVLEKKKYYKTVRCETNAEEEVLKFMQGLGWKLNSRTEIYNKQEVFDGAFSINGVGMVFTEDKVTNYISLFFERDTKETVKQQKLYTDYFETQGIFKTHIQQFIKEKKKLSKKKFIYMLVAGILLVNTFAFFVGGLASLIDAVLADTDILYSLIFIDFSLFAGLISIVFLRELKKTKIILEKYERDFYGEELYDTMENAYQEVVGEKISR